MLWLHRLHLPHLRVVGGGLDAARRATRRGVHHAVEIPAGGAADEREERGAEGAEIAVRAELAVVGDGREELVALWRGAGQIDRSQTLGPS